MSENQQSVVVTDIKMPFWSMVLFIVKFSVAAIPAIALLSAIGAVTVLLITGLMHGITRSNNVAERPPIYVPETRPTGRCFGSTDREKCLEIERRLETESAAAKKARQQALEAERRANMEQVK